MNNKNTVKVVVLTGAGISAESGIRTFRASDGLWEDHKIEDVATPEGFARDPNLVLQFYNQRRRDLLAPSIKPNAAHIALAKLEQKLLSENFLLVTQNYNLHERAGSKNLIHMHGELLKARCCDCNTVIECNCDLDTSSHCPTCGGSLRPHIVWFGEMPFAMDRIYQALQQCDLFISIGTSGNVYPAAGFVQEAKTFDARTVELNLEKSKGFSAFDEGYYGNATEVVPEFIAKLDL